MEVPAGANFAEQGIHGESSRRNDNSRIRTEIENTAEGEFWPEMQTLPQQLFVNVSDGSKGLALLNDCLTEYQLLDDDCRTLALTLFRSIRTK